MAIQVLLALSLLQQTGAFHFAGLGVPATYPYSHAGYHAHTPVQNHHFTWPTTGYTNNLHALSHQISQLKTDLEKSITSIVDSITEFYAHGGGPIKAALVGGSNETLGAVQLSRQIKYGDADSVQTGWLCHDYFEDNDNGARVVCRMLGFSDGVYADAEDVVVDSNSISTGRMILDDVVCAGTEATIGDCADQYWDANVGDCDMPDEIAGVICSP